MSASAAGDRVRVRPGARPGELLIERAQKAFAGVRLGRGSEVVLHVGERDYEIALSEDWDVALRTPAGEVAASHDDRRLGHDRITFGAEVFELRLPGDRRRGSLRGPGGVLLAEFEVRHPEQGSVLLVEVLEPSRTPDVLLAFAATVAYLRTRQARMRRRFGETQPAAASTVSGLWGAYLVGSGDWGGGDACQ